MLAGVRYQNVKSLQNVSLTLQPFTMLVGGNGSGKTAILQGIGDLLQCTKRVPSTIFKGARHPTRIGRPNPHQNMEIECFGEGFNAFGTRLSMADEGRFVLWYGQGHQRSELHAPRLPSGDDPEGAFYRRLAKWRIGTAVYLRISARAAVEPHYSEEEDATVEPDGYGLPSVLQRLQLLRDGRFEEVEAALARIVPSVRRLRAAPHKVRRPERLRVSVDGTDGWVEQVRERTGARIEAEVVGGGWVPADLLSEGTILALALLTVLSAEAPELVLLDDLDQGLHPTAQGRMMAELRAIQRARRGLQIVATTHSPFLVDACAVEEVRVVRLDEGGATRCRPLAEHPLWARRSGFLRPGEFWSGVGEGWIGV